MGPLSQCCLFSSMDNVRPCKRLHCSLLKAVRYPQRGWLSAPLFPLFSTFPPISPHFPQSPPHFPYFLILPQERCWEPYCRLCWEFLGLEG